MPETGREGEERAREHSQGVKRGRDTARAQHRLAVGGFWLCLWVTVMFPGLTHAQSCAVSLRQTEQRPKNMGITASQPGYPRAVGGFRHKQHRWLSEGGVGAAFVKGWNPCGRMVSQADSDKQGAYNWAEWVSSCPPHRGQGLPRLRRIAPILRETQGAGTGWAEGRE